MQSCFEKGIATDGRSHLQIHALRFLSKKDGARPARAAVHDGAPRPHWLAEGGDDLVHRVLYCRATSSIECNGQTLVCAKLAAFENGIQWWLGDWWHYGFHAYGDRKAKVKAKGAFPYAFQTLMNWGWVAGMVETSLTCARMYAYTALRRSLPVSLGPKIQRDVMDQNQSAIWKWLPRCCNVQNNSSQNEIP